MKKQYIDPAMEVVKIETMSVLAVSDKSAIISDETQDNSAALGRSGDFDDWDD